MAFSDEERSMLLAVKGVGPTVVDRLEQIGISTFDELREYSVEEITGAVAKMLSKTCWKNSPQAKAAIQAAIDLASEMQC